MIQSLPSNPPVEVSPTPETLAEFNIFTPRALAHRVAESGTAEYMIENLIPKQGISLVVGDSGLGKSPWLYQAATCVAAGLPFVGHAVPRPGRVLWMDCENSIAQVQQLVSDIARFLRLPEIPENLLCWNLNDCGNYHGLEALVQAARPDWVIIDPLRTILEGCDKDNPSATAAYNHLRKIMSALRCTITGVHHIRKPHEDHSTPLEGTDLNEWFVQAIGARTLITGCDVRIGVDKAKTPEADIIVRGFARVRGEFPSLLLARVRDDQTGEPVGYRRLEGVDLLNERNRGIFYSLPDRFRFSDAKRAVGGNSDSGTKSFLQACEAALLMRKLPNREGYEKLPAELPVLLKAA